MTHCDDRELSTIIENGEVGISLKSGTVGLLIRKERPNKRGVTVETPGAKVRVKGTVFAVHVDSEDERVGVFKGVVEVIPATRDADAFEVAAGHGADVRGNKTFRLSNPKTEVLKRKLVSGAAVQESA
jgi:ferric-dicitrate binding protein FerR (iron transport regulator)